MTEPTITALVTAKLAASGLTPLDGKRLGFRALTATETRRLSPTFHPYPALKLPYADLRGKPTGFYRLRYLGALNGFDALRAKPLRYVQPPDTTSEAYFPSGFGLDWAALAEDPNIALVITEGELKACAGAKAGLPVIGLGGVWSWKSKKKMLTLLPALAAINWKGRRVYLIFDSDYLMKPDVMAALVALAKELTARGALPNIVTLPALEGVGKTGLDDFLVAEGKAALSPLLQDAPMFELTRGLWELNTEVTYVRDPGIIIELATGQKMSAADFKTHSYANRHFVERAPTKLDPDRVVEKPLAPAWLEWPLRAEVKRLTYAPGEPRLTDAGEYNTWTGWGVESKRGDVTPWRDLLAYLFAGHDAERSWFERWAAYPIARPGTKLYAASVLWGVATGTGKSLIGYSLGRVYGQNFSEISDDDLASSFNEWAQHKQFVMGDDVTGSEYKKTLMDRLKGMITRQQLRINAKFMPTYIVPDRVNYYFTSNHPDAFIIEDFDRRYFVHETPATPLADAFYHKYDAWYKSDAGAAALRWHLEHHDLGDFNPSAKAPRTAAKDAMTFDAKSDIGTWVAQLKESPDDVLRFGAATLTADLYTTGQLLHLYDPEDRKRVTANGLSRELKRAGFRQVWDGAPIKTARGTQRLYAIRNAGRWLRAKPTALAEHWNAAFGGAAPADGPKKPKF